MSFAFGFSLFGLISFLYRLKPWRTSKIKSHPLTEVPLPLVSIIVPCRNEEASLPSLLSTLKNLTYPRFEVLVIDDHSEDQTFAIAQSFGVKALKAPPKPESWGGKNWPCDFGSQQATGDLFLFTDADTFHKPESLKKAVEFLQNQKADFISAPPFHACEKWWEKLLGLFQLLPLIATAYRNPPKPNRLFAIGQYMLITKSSYHQLGGHQTIASSLVDDIDLAKLWLQNDKVYQVYPDAGLYEVQMFSSFQSFLQGWKRLLRLGLGRSSWISVLETTGVLYLFSFSFFEGDPAALLLSIMGIILLALTQHRFGRFSIFGLLMAPMNVLLFVGLSFAAIVEALLRKDIQWHGRSYQRS